MKKVLLYFIALTCITALFSSCEKDDAFADITEQISTETNGKVIDTETNQRRHRCGSEAHMTELLKNPEYLKLHQAKFNKLENAVLSRSCSSPTILPIAVHYQNVSGADLACLQQLAQSQVAVLNADYQGSNSDISLWNNNVASNFPGISNGEACLGFQIATKNHPSGYGLNDGDLAVTVNKVSGDFSNDWSGYINIFVQPNTGVLGYSPLGGSGNGDGVVIDAAAFGKGSGCGSISPQSPYNLGRTLTHEMGHYLLLDHIWGNGCGSDDGVADTPNSQQEYYDCPSIGESSCNSTDMHMNYMDYTNDECMYMFSAGQATRMEGYVTSSLSNVVNNASNVLGSGGGNGGGGNTPTCNDGIQNGNETGVDCGGSCTPCNEPVACTAPTNSQTSEVNATTVKITWTAIPDAIRYRIRYREVGTSTWLKKSTVNNEKSINNLVNGADYQYQLRTRCSDNSWTTWGATSTFSVGNSSGGGNGSCLELTLELTLDDYGSETSWEVENEYGEIVAEGGNYADFQSGTTKIETFCLADGCYTFYMYDEYGDGICCEYGNGKYKVKDDAGRVVFQSNGYFGTYEANDFCITEARLPELKNHRSDEKLEKTLKTR